jgi:glycosyltransferase involved in cell wall biosynthesis
MSAGSGHGSDFMQIADILLATGTAYLPQVVGGLEVNTHELTVELNRRGHKTAVLAKLSARDAFGAKRLLSSYWHGSLVSFDQHLGYDVYRSREPWRALGSIGVPKIAVIQNGNMLEMAAAFSRAGVPCVAYFHGLPFESPEHRWPEPTSEWPFRAYIANSEYTAGRFRTRFGIDAEVIPPLFRPERYRTAAQGRFVTFVNPVAPKGLDLALAIARICREIPFRFVKGWRLSARDAICLRRAIAKQSNVELIDRVMDMKPVYAATRILLVPSQWNEETWGRVASEAQFSGIPILASNVGGLPEAVGTGGVVLPHDAPAATWAIALRRLWHDADYYEQLSKNALSHSRRETIDLDRQIDHFLAILALRSQPLIEVT